MRKVIFFFFFFFSPLITETEWSKSGEKFSNRNNSPQFWNESKGSRRSVVQCFFKVKKLLSSALKNDDRDNNMHARRPLISRWINF